MNITFVTTYLTLYGGMGQFTEDYANGLCKKGHNITIIAQKIDKDVYRFNKKISLIEVGGPFPSSFLHWILFKKIEKNYINVLKKSKSDLIISQNFPSNYFCERFRKKYSAASSFKLIFYCHEPFRLFYDKEYMSRLPIFLRIINYFFKIIFNKYDFESALKADSIICNSFFSKKQISKIYKKEAYVHYTGIHIEDNLPKLNTFNLRQHLMINKNDPIIFVLGLSHIMKGAKDLIYTFNKVLKELHNTILLIGGRIKKENKAILKKLIKKLKISSRNIIFYGPVEKKLLNYFYSQSSLTFFMAKNEPFGLIPLESMKNGTPVIAFEQGGPSETIEDGMCGYLIKYNDLDSFAQKAIKLLKDKDLYESFSKNAKEHIRKKFSIEKGLLNFEMILKKIS